MCENSEKNQVTALPGLSNAAATLFDQYTGYINVDNVNDASLFYWYFKSKTQDPQQKGLRQKLLIWLNGGPGVSSLDGVFMGNGPFLPSSTQQTLIDNSENSFLNAGAGSVLFLDQPAGTGFSYSQNMSRIGVVSTQAALEFVIFIRKFMGLFQDEFGSGGVDLYLGGESYAGVYIPHFANALLQDPIISGSNNSTSVRVAGLYIGNGWIDPRPQYMSYLDYVLEQNLIPSSYLSSARTQHEICRKILDFSRPQGAKNTVLECDEIVTKLHEAWQNYHATTLLYFNQYLTSETDSDRGNSWPQPTMSLMSTYLNRQDVRIALCVSELVPRWTETNSQIFNAFTGDGETSPGIALFEGLIDRGVKIYLATGDKDLVSNHIGIQWSLSNLTSNSRYVLDDTSRTWKLGAEAGYVYQASNLDAFVVRGGSHMLSVDKPHVVSALVKLMLGFNASVAGITFSEGFDGPPLRSQSVSTGSGVEGVLKMYIPFLAFGLSMLAFMAYRQFIARKSTSDQGGDEHSFELFVQQDDDEDEVIRMEDFTHGHKQKGGGGSYDDDDLESLNLYK